MCLKEHLIPKKTNLNSRPELWLCLTRTRNNLLCWSKTSWWGFWEVERWSCSRSSPRDLEDDEDEDVVDWWLFELWKVFLSWIINSSYIQGDTTGSSQPPVDIKTNGVFQYMLLILKHNFCFDVSRRLGTTWCVTLYNNFCWMLTLFKTSDSRKKRLFDKYCEDSSPLSSFPANGDTAEIRLRSHAFHQLPRQSFPIFNPISI